MMLMNRPDLTWPQERPAHTKATYFDILFHLSTSVIQALPSTSTSDVYSISSRRSIPCPSMNARTRFG